MTKKILCAAAALLLALALPAFAELDLYDVQRDMLLGKTTIVIPAEAQNSDLSAIVDCIKTGEGITLDLSETKITKIGDRVFGECNALKAIILPKGLTSIGEFAFISCRNLTQVVIPGSVTSIEYQAFSGCESLTQVAIPGSVTSIGTYAFTECSGLTKIDVASGNRHYSSVDGVLFSKDKKTLVWFPQAKTSRYYEIPEGVTSIGIGAFYGCSGLTQVAMPDSVTSIEMYAFRECKSITQVVISSGVTSIDGYAFWHSSSLTKIDVASGNKNYSSVDGVLFSKDKKTLVCYPAGRDKYYEIPQGVTSINKYAFAWCKSLTQVVIPNSVTNIGSAAFWGCSALTQVTIPRNVTSIESSAFYGCKKLAQVVIPNNVTSIGESAFSGCKSLTQVVIPNSVTNIGSAAFWECSALTQVTIPRNVTSIEGSAFYGCKKLAQVVFADTKGWYFDEGFTRPVAAGDLASSLMNGWALFKKAR